MKTINVRDLQRRIRECVDSAQKDRVVITRGGAPAAVLIGVAGQDWEDVTLRTSTSFWRMIEARRREPTVPLEAVRRKFRGARRRGQGRRPSVAAAIGKGVGGRRRGSRRPS